MTRNQLTLLEPDVAWHLDEPTRDVGRRGIAAARAVLQASRRSLEPAQSLEPGQPLEPAESLDHRESDQTVSHPFAA